MYVLHLWPALTNVFQNVCMRYILQDLKIHVIGVNTLNMDPEHLSLVKKVEKMCIQVEFTPLKPEKERELLQELQASQFVIEADLTSNNDDQGSYITWSIYSILSSLTTHVILSLMLHVHTIKLMIVVFKQPYLKVNSNF